MKSMHYYAPVSLEEAGALLIEHKGSKVLAGGTDLLVQLRQGGESPSALVDIKNIAPLKQIEITPAGELIIGAAASCASLTESEKVAAQFPGLTDAIGLIGSTQIQGRCTVGGNLCNGSPAADTVPALMVNNALCDIQSTQGVRQVDVSAFNLGPHKNCLAEGEFLRAIRIPALASDVNVTTGVVNAATADAYLRFIPRTEMDIAVVGAAVSVTLNSGGQCIDARIAIGAVGPTALLVPDAAQALVGTALEEDALQTAGRAARQAADPISDKRGTADYRRKIVAVLVRRATVIAQHRAMQKHAGETL